MDRDIPLLIVMLVVLSLILPTPKPNYINYEQIWAGYYYVDRSNQITFAKANIIVPYVDCQGANDTTGLSAWVGIWGAQLDQSGITELCHNQTPVYSAWYENFPADPHGEGLNIQINAGDSIVVTVAISNGVATYQMQDQTTNRIVNVQDSTGINVAQLYAGCIVERFSLSGVGPITLVNFNQIHFQSCLPTSANATVRYQLLTVVMTDTGTSSGIVLAQPTPMNLDSSFTVIP